MKSEQMSQEEFDAYNRMQDEIDAYLMKVGAVAPPEAIKDDTLDPRLTDDKQAEGVALKR